MMSKGQRVQRDHLQGVRPAGSNNLLGPVRGVRGRTGLQAGEPVRRVCRGWRGGGEWVPRKSNCRAGRSGGRRQRCAGPAHCRQVTQAPRGVASRGPRRDDWLLQGAPPPQL